jgi:hypothetical protein
MNSTRHVVQRAFAATGVQDVDLGVLLDREHEPLSIFYVNRVESFDVSLGIGRYVNVSN